VRRLSAAGSLNPSSGRAFQHVAFDRLMPIKPTRDVSGHDPMFQLQQSLNRDVAAAFARFSAYASLMRYKA
jgi:hypothetical protein